MIERKHMRIATLVALAELGSLDCLFTLYLRKASLLHAKVYSIIRYLSLIFFNSPSHVGAEWPGVPLWKFPNLGQQQLLYFFADSKEQKE